MIQDVNKVIRLPIRLVVVVLDMKGATCIVRWDEPV